MKLLKSNDIGNIDLAIVGLGYETRATTRCRSMVNSNIIAIGYDQHTSALRYQDNLEYYNSIGATVIEGDNCNVYRELFKLIDVQWTGRPVNCLIDITVLSRTRLAEIILYLISNLEEGSHIKVSYSLAEYTEPSNSISPMRKVGPIIDSLSGALGDINLPSSIVIGLGYEIGKAIGISNYLDTENQFIFIPNGKDSNFETSVRTNNELLINITPENHTFTYDICNPYKTYLDLRETMLAIMDISRPVLVPLGPKIFSALSVVLSEEMNRTLPVWRVSSEYLEEPVDRKPTGFYIEFTLVT
ncbi:Conserved hypothetical protein [Shewanella piezotolerans WP3]|uniref:Uncharacterized protein n=1 Tax=Shewanella piezotolerans (strain WP3 / JCM 13877) TaxID=225849 RepID=B8CJ48_SHEPW|nr:hypothetical protein [Shewanella piezotolerans]ACJ27810.1 Conserved hypothetical protein [Shewanella piezotolerans WP3]